MQVINWYRCIYLDIRSNRLIAGQWYSVHPEETAASHIDRMITKWPNEPLWDIETSVKINCPSNRQDYMNCFDY